MASQSNTGAAGVDILSIAYAEKEYSEILYYLADGTMLDGYGTILFMNEQMKCVQEIGRIVIRDSMGNGFCQLFFTFFFKGFLRPSKAGCGNAAGFVRKRRISVFFAAKIFAG